MKKFEFINRIESIERLNSSVNGNPRFIVTMVNGLILNTKSDYSYCYNIENLYKKNCLVRVLAYETKTKTMIQSINEVKITL